jgi:hypothetical protein
MLKPTQLREPVPQAILPLIGPEKRPSRRAVGDELAEGFWELAGSGEFGAGEYDFGNKHLERIQIILHTNSATTGSQARLKGVG